MPSFFLPEPPQSTHTHPHYRRKRPVPIKKHKVLAAMSARCTSSTLEPFLGTYHIVWDSESNYDPRDVLFDAARLERDPDDGLLTLARPQRAQGWPKEPAPASSIVLRFCDGFLGTDRTASVLKPSPRPTPGPASAAPAAGVHDAWMRSTPSSRFSSSSSPSLAPPRSRKISSSSSSSSRRPSPIYLSPPHSSTSTSTSPSPPSSSPSPSPSPSPSSTPTSKGARRFWRFDWDPSFPRLGFRFEGMDLTARHGHALSFARIRDDRGVPFAVLDLRVTPARRPEGARGGERRGAQEDAQEEEDEEGEGEEGQARYITVVAKRVRDRYAREGLSDAERARLGMVELDELDARASFYGR